MRCTRPSAWKKTDIPCRWHSEPGLTRKPNLAAQIAGADRHTHASRAAPDTDPTLTGVLGGILPTGRPACKKDHSPGLRALRHCEALAARKNPA